MKRFVSLFLGLVILFSSSLAYANINGKISFLQEKEIVQGRILEDGSIDLALDQPITRAEFSKIMAVAISLSEEIPDFTFIDIQDHWARAYIDKLSNDPRGIIVGYEDGYFRPDNPISNAELAAMMVKASKKDLTDQDKLDAVWPDSYVLWADEENLFQGLDIADINAKASRQTAFEMLYNTMAVLALENPASAEEFSEFDPALRGQSFDWIYNAMDRLGKVDPEDSKLKEELGQIFGSPSLKKGDKAKLNIKIVGKWLDGDFIADSKISGSRSLLKPESMTLNGDFSQLTLSYSRTKTDKFVGSYLQAYFNGQSLETKIDLEKGQIIISTADLYDILAKGQEYSLELVLEAGRDIE
ncbi:MAG: S-layer homology domain-containing protein [Bacillota bacterium]|nr:S-layer homology domain-containing protein [Bacillota bacterium]